MKYIDADKLITEIERRIDSWSTRGKNSPVGQGKDTCESRVTELSDLLSFITTLQQEQSDVDLEKEIDEYFPLWRQGASDEGCVNANSQFVSLYDCTQIARYFYKLGLNARKEE